MKSLKNTPYLATISLLILQLQITLAYPSMTAEDEVDFGNYYDMSQYSRCLIGIIGGHSKSWVDWKIGCSRNNCFCTKLDLAWARIKDYKSNPCEWDELSLAWNLARKYCLSVEGVDPNPSIAKAMSSSEPPLLCEITINEDDVDISSETIRITCPTVSPQATKEDKSTSTSASVMKENKSASGSTPAAEEDKSASVSTPAAEEDKIEDAGRNKKPLSNEAIIGIVSAIAGSLSLAVAVWVCRKRHVQGRSVGISR